MTTVDLLLSELARVADGTALAVEPAGYDEHLQAITDAAKDLFSAGACSLALVDPTGDYLVYRIASGAGSDVIIEQKLPIGQGLAGWVVSSGMPLALDDVTADPRFQRDVAERTGYVPHSLLAMPLETDRAVLGVISVFDRELPIDAAAAQREMRLLGLFARQAALALEAAQVLRSAGRLLLSALSTATRDGDLLAALERARTEVKVADAPIAEVATLIARIGRADPELAPVIAEALDAVVEYAEGKQRL